MHIAKSIKIQCKPANIMLNNCEDLTLNMESVVGNLEVHLLKMIV